MHIMHLLFGIHGRITRKEWWKGQIIVAILSTIIYLVFWHAWTHHVFLSIGLTFTFGWMRMCVDFKRLVDRNLSIFWLVVFMILEFIPFIGHTVIMIVCGFLKSKGIEDVEKTS